MATGESVHTNDAVVFICGAGHSGSTLLGMMLGSHPDVFYAGEARKSRYVGDESRPLRKRVCKLCGPPCPVWGAYRTTTDAELYDQLSELTRRPVVVDSTKNVDWIRSQVARLGETPARAALIFLIRDGRAVVNSRVRKYPERDHTGIVRDWVDQMAATRALFEEHAGPRTVVHYEQLAADPARVLEGVCTDVGLAYDPVMLDFATSTQHPLGGNNGAQYLVARQSAAAGPAARLSGRTRPYYGSHPGSVVLDERWRREMPDGLEALFGRIAGPVLGSLVPGPAS